MRIFLLSLLLGFFMTPSSLFAAERVFVIKKPLSRIIVDVASYAGNSHAESISEDRLASLTAFDIQLSFRFVPHRGYYTMRIVLLEQMNRVTALEKTLEIWAYQDQTMFRSRLEVDTCFRCNLIQRIANRIVNRMEHKILSMEEFYIRRYGE